MSNKVIVVGAGIAGLSAGIYAAQSGFDVTIAEKHDIAGGVCTSWRRKGYLFEGGIHWMTGTSPSSIINKFWRETGALEDKTPIYNNDPYLYLNYEGVDLFLYRNVKRLREHLLCISPQDKNAIDKLCKDINAYAAIKDSEQNEKEVKLKFTATPPSLRDFFAMIPALFRMNKHLQMPACEYLNMFKHPGIRLLLASSVPSYFPAMPLLFTIAVKSAGDGGYPEGGSLPMTARMADTYTALGGKLLLGTKVEKVLVENGEARGVMADGRRIDADAVIVANDTLTAIPALFDTPPADDWINGLKEDEAQSCVCTFAGIGVKADFSRLPPAVILKLKEPLDVAGEKIPDIIVNNYSGHSGYAPEGGTALTLILGTDDTYDWWLRAKNSGVYEDEKNKLKLKLETILVSAFPQAREKIEVIDIATPLTYERYTGSWHGSWMGKIIPGVKMRKKYPCTLKDIRHAYFAGFRMEFPGGLPGALISGRRAAQLVCRDFDVVFQNRV
jgi:phytoene dehydrogenase-like protein